MQLHNVTVMLAQAAAPSGEESPLLTWMLLLAAMTLLPFLLTMITSFAKIVVVGGIVRQAIGAQVPPNSVITGLAMILSIHIMWPVGWDAYSAYQDASSHGASVVDAAQAGAEPLRKFLTSHSSAENQDLFRSMQTQLQNADAASNATSRPMSPEAARWTEIGAVDIPAFVLTELKQAFEIGFLLFIPFLVIDLIVGNILVSMGMTMLTPTTISLPLKLLLFVLVDGWRLLIQGLVTGYT